MHPKYEVSISYGSKVIAKVKVDNTGTKINGRPVAKGDQLCSRATKSLYLVAHLAIGSSRMSHSSFIEKISTGATH